MKKGLLLIIAVYLANIVFGQTGIEMPNIIPPSPNARTFQKYGEFPVSYYTGTPNISIPIYTISLKDVVLPVTLTYNASGIKVEEEAGRTGLGWALNAGGMITHTIMGRYDDFYEGVYFNSWPENNLNDLTHIAAFTKYTLGTYNNPLPFTPTPMSKFDFWAGVGADNIACGGVELAPDVFTYSFLGYSGKFIFSHSGNIIKENEDNLIIEPSLAANGKLLSFVITGPNGTKYYFNQTEAAQIPDQGLQRGKYNSGFYLTSIQTINGTNISLSYKKTNSVLGTFNRVQDTRLDNDVSINYANYEVVYLDKITYPNGTLRFEYAFDRVDYTPEPRLTKIYIDREGVNISKWQFNYDYFIANASTHEMPTLQRLQNIMNNAVSYYNTDWNSKRLKLTGVQKVVGTDNYKYDFAYHEEDLPTKLSTAIDHWGYYNGAINYWMIPHFYHNISQTPGVVDLEADGLGADREPSETKSQAFLLKEVTYPTGGKTQFVYEANKYKTNIFENDSHKRDFMYSKNSTKLEEGVGWNNVPIEYVHTEPISLPYTTDGGNKAIIHVRIKIVVDDSYNTSTGEKTLFMSLENESTGSKPWSFTFQAPYLPSMVNDANRTYERVWNDIEADIGDYKIKVYGSLRTYIRSTEVEVTNFIYPAEYLAANPVGIGGGVRVKEIKSYNSDETLAFRKKFTYTFDGSETATQTSGKLMFYPRYQNSDLSTGSNGLRGSGYSVGYSMVQVWDLSDTETPIGKSVYEYVNIPDKNLYYTWKDTPPAGLYAIDENPLGIGAYRYAENGTLLKEQIYKFRNGSFLPVKLNEFTYDIRADEPSIVWGLLKSRFVPIDNSVCYQDADLDFIESQPVSDRAFGYFYPAMRPLWVRLSQKKETLFEGEDSFQTISTYYHNSQYHYLTKQVTQSSNGDMHSVEYTYPPDLATSNPIMQTLKNSNRITESIHTKEQLNGNEKIISKEYALFDNVPRLAIVKTNSANNRDIESRLQYVSYDQKGNPLKFLTSNGPSSCYLWSYNGQYPVAEIKNALQEDIAYTSFEADGKGNWSYSGATVADNTAPTGSKVYNLAGGSINRSGLTAGKRYILSYWAKSSLATGISGGTATVIGSRTGWTHYKRILNGSTSVTLTGSVYVDEIRLYPESAQMTTYTYDPLVGMTSSTDASGRTTYYEYDGFGRLKTMKDMQQKPVSYNDYHYLNQ